MRFSLCLVRALADEGDRFGLEGLVTFKRENEYDAETYEIAVPSEAGPAIRIGVFDKVKVEISVEKVSMVAPGESG